MTSLTEVNSFLIPILILQILPKDIPLLTNSQYTNSSFVNLRHFIRLSGCQLTRRLGKDKTFLITKSYVGS